MHIHMHVHISHIRWLPSWRSFPSRMRSGRQGNKVRHFTTLILTPLLPSPPSPSPLSSPPPPHPHPPPPSFSLAADSSSHPPPSSSAADSSSHPHPSFSSVADSAFLSGEVVRAVQEYSSLMPYGTSLPSLLGCRAACRLKLGECVSCFKPAPPRQLGSRSNPHRRVSWAAGQTRLWPFCLWRLIYSACGG